MRANQLSLSLYCVPFEQRVSLKVNQYVTLVSLGLPVDFFTLNESYYTNFEILSSKLLILGAICVQSTRPSV